MKLTAKRAGWLPALLLLAIAGPLRADKLTPPLTEQNYPENLPIALASARLLQQVASSSSSLTNIKNRKRMDVP